MQTSLRFNRLHLLSVLLVVFASVYALAQGIVTGTISGVVEDAQGAVVTNAKITAKEIATNRVFTAQTTAEGLFAVRALPPGHYQVTIEAANFRKYENKDVEVVVGAETGLGRVRMEIGSSTETVTVEGTTPLIETSTQQITNTFESEEVKSLPIGNNLDTLTLFAPGVAPAGDAGFSNNNGSEFAVNGLRARDNNFQLDGQNNNDNSIGGPSIFFGNQDAIDQIQVVTQYDAQYGHNSGSVVNYITKSGTNVFHGSAYEFWAGNTFASKDNIEILTGSTIPRFVDNRFGGTIGGPIVKDKVWFFASANIEKQRGPGDFSTAPFIVPTPNGISQLATEFPGSPVAELYTEIGPSAVSGVTYSNKTLVPVQSSADCFVTPNDPTCIEFATANRSVPSPYNDYEATGRVDIKLSNKDNFFARYIFQRNESDGINFGLGNAVGDWQDIPGQSQQIGLDWVRNFNPTLINQVRLSYSRAGFYFNEGGFTGCNKGAPLNCPPEIVLESPVIGTFNNQQTVFPTNQNFGVASGFPQGRVINVYQLQDNASKQIGRHTIKFGGELSQQRSPNLFLPNDNTLWIFGDFNALTANSPIGGSGTRVTYGNPHLPFKEWDLAFYTQDDWRIKDNLTLNIGIRWEWNQQAINLLHDESVRNQLGPNPFWDPSLPLSQNTVPSVPQSLHNFTPVLGFAWTPRVGGFFGHDSTVIRGGFRISYDPEFYNIFLNVGTSAPTVDAISSVAPLPASGFNGANLQAYLQQFPAFQGGLQHPVNSGIRNHTTVAPGFHNPYTEEWNFGVQHSFNPKVVGEVRYVGNHAVGLFQSVNGNPALNELLTAADPSIGGNPAIANVIPAGLTPCTDPTKPGGNIYGYINCNFRRTVERGNFGWSKYHSLQNELRIGQWHGVTSTASYTWSHGMDNASEIFSTIGGGNTLSFAQNPFDTNRGERGNSGINFPNLFSIAFIYDLPFAKGRNDFVGKTVGGWQVNTTYRYAPGQPYTVIQTRFAGSYFYTNTGTSLCDPSATMSGTYDACRPILLNKAAPFTSVGVFCDGTVLTCSDPTGTVANSLGTLISKFDPCYESIFSGTPCSVTPISTAHWVVNDNAAAEFYGTPFKGVGRNTVTGQSISQVNLGVFKNTKLTEKLTLQIQVQAFNVMNRQYRGSPDPLIDDAGSSFGNNFFNSDGGANSTANAVFDGIGRRRLLFGGKLIF